MRFQLEKTVLRSTNSKKIAEIRSQQQLEFVDRRSTTIDKLFNPFSGILDWCGFQFFTERAVDRQTQPIFLTNLQILTKSGASHD